MPAYAILMALFGPQEVVIPLPEVPTYQNFLLVLEVLEDMLADFETVVLSFDQLIQLGLIMKEIDKNCLPLAIEAHRKLNPASKTETRFSAELKKTRSDIMRIANLRTLRHVLADLRNIKGIAQHYGPSVEIRAPTYYPDKVCTQTEILAHIKTLIQAYINLIKVLEKPLSATYQSRLEAALSHIPNEKDLYHLLAVARAETSPIHP